MSWTPVFFGAAIGSSAAILFTRGAMIVMGWHCDSIERDLKRDEYWQGKVNTIGEFIEWLFKPEYRTRGAFSLGFVAGLLFATIVVSLLQGFAK